jgi:hypothetical protein
MNEFAMALWATTASHHHLAMPLAKEPAAVAAAIVCEQAPPATLSCRGARATTPSPIRFT